MADKVFEGFKLFAAFCVFFVFFSFIKVFKIFKFVAGVYPKRFCIGLSDAQNIETILPQFEGKAVVIGIGRNYADGIYSLIGVCKFYGIHYDCVVGCIGTVSKLLDRPDRHFFKPRFPAVHVGSSPVPVQSFYQYLSFL